MRPVTTGPELAFALAHGAGTTTVSLQPGSTLVLDSSTWPGPVALNRSVTIEGGCYGGLDTSGQPCTGTLDLSRMANAIVLGQGVALTLKGLTLVNSLVDPGDPSLADVVGMRAIRASPGAAVYWDNVVGLLPGGLGLSAAWMQSLLQEMRSAAAAGGLPPRARARMALEVQDVSGALPEGASLLCGMAKAPCIMNCTVQVRAGWAGLGPAVRVCPSGFLPLFCICIWRWPPHAWRDGGAGVPCIARGGTFCSA